MKKALIDRYIMIALCLLLNGLACVKIETGPETGEQRRETSSLRAKDFKVNWADRFDLASPVKKAEMLKNFVDTISIRYINYGFQVVDEWREGNAGRGSDVPDSEMREVVARWNENESPMLEAYEEVIEYSINDIKRTNHFDTDILGLFDRNIELFYKINGVVFYPSGTVNDYLHELEELNADLQDFSQNLARELEMYI